MGHRLDTDAIGVTIHQINQLAPFASPDDARTVLKSASDPAPWVGDAMVEIGL